MSDWGKTNLGNLGVVVTGKTPSKKNPEDWGTEIHFITPTDFKNYFKYADTSLRKLSIVGERRLIKKVLPKNAVLVTCIGSDMGKVALTSEKSITNQQINAIIPAEGVSADFIYYQLINMYPLLKSLGSGGTAVPILNKSTFEAIECKVPSFYEQQAIAEVLSSIDDKVDLLNRQNETLEAMAQTLFRQWFIEEADESWEEVKLSSIVQIRYGKNLPTKNMTDSGYPVCGANGIIGFYSTYNYEHKQVLVSCRGEASGKVNFSPPKSYVTNNSLVLERISTVVSFEFLKYQALNFEFKSFVTGSAQPQITIKNLELATITLPPSNLIENYSVLVRSFESKMDQNLKSVQVLIKTRDSLLPKLMSGEVRVELD